MLQLIEHYTDLTTKEAVFDEACLLSQISREASSFFFGVQCSFWRVCLRFVELQRGLNIHLPFIELFNQKVYASLKHHAYTF